MRKFFTVGLFMLIFFAVQIELKANTLELAAAAATLEVEQSVLPVNFAKPPLFSKTSENSNMQYQNKNFDIYKENKIIGKSFFNVPDTTGSYELDFGLEAFLISTGAALFIVNWIVDANMSTKSAFDYGPEKLVIDDVNFLDRWAMTRYSSAISIASDVTVSLVAAMPLIFLFDSKMNDLIIYFTMYGESLLFANGIKDLAKTVMPRYRPYSYFDNTGSGILKDSDSTKSFFSGHTAFAFTAASFFSNVYSETHKEGSLKYWLSAAAYGAAATTGVLRICAGMHFISDVVAGMAVGTFTGYIIPKIHQVSKQKKDDVELVVYPSGIGSIYGKVAF